MSRGRLDGWGIVVTRPRPEADRLAEELAREGARVFVFPALAIEDVPPSPALRAALERLAEASIAIFVSANAVGKGLEAARRHGAWPAGIRVAAIGEATARALREAGFAEVIAPRAGNDSDALLAAAELQQVRGLTVVIFRGEGGRERLRQVLESRGARVHYAECYRRARPATDPLPLLEAWARREVNAVSALSAETLDNFVSMVGAEGARRMKDATLVVPHEAIVAHPLAARFGRVAVAAPGAAGIATALSQLRVTP